MPLGPADPNGPSEFDIARKRAATEAQANLQSRREAMSRRFSQLGGGPSGAHIKLEQQAIADSGRQAEEANERIDSAERSEMQRRREILENRQYQTSERLGGQQFAAEQSALGRRFATSERLGGQEFAAGQADLGRKFTTSERLGSQNFARGERQSSQIFQGDQAQKQRAWQSSESALGRAQQASQFQSQLDFAKAQHQDAQWWQKVAYEQNKDQFDRTFNFNVNQFRHEEYIDEQNLKLAARIQRFNEQEDPGLLGMGGLLGTGIGGQRGVLGSGVFGRGGGR